DWSKPFYDAKGVTQIPFAENELLQNIVKAAAAVTKGELRNMSRTTTVGIKTKNGFQPIGSFYKKTVDEAISAVATGTMDYNSIVRQAIKDMGSSGLRVQYESGYTRRLDSAIRQNIIDGVSYIAKETARQAGEEFGADGVELSAHSPCAPDHLPYQGKQYSLKEYDELQASLKRPIGEWNCRHFPYPILLGISRPANSRAELAEMERESNRKIEIDGNEYTRYECTQMQRKLETKLRYAREEKAVYQAAGQADLVREATEKIRILGNKYQEVSEKAGLPTRAERMRIFSGKKADSTRVVAESKTASKKLEFLENKRIEEYNKKQEEIRKLIRSDVVNKTINKGAQNKHIPSAKGYIEGRSYIFGNLEEAQALVDQYAGTGKAILTRKGDWANKEVIVADKVIGMVVDFDTKDAASTKKFVIHYGKRGAHIVPAKEE
ncbi:MAG: phage minor capsid protein, partial [Anaerotignum sp.]